ncbi:hypothetical protein E2C01_024066 [Portunus trituberculatus]|uniref:Uncharacterized protein n=1 Tax=Portunus trituberculatus TaxID=210409 RepID=A0A5B7EBL9_PORTR|nr:hypothetical protein [Portunus trituberculatus]
MVDVVSSAEENVVAASASWAASPVSEEDSGAASSVPDKLDLFMQWMSQQMKEQLRQLRQEIRKQSL